MPQSPQSSARRELANMIESSDDGDRPSITDAHGTIARFEMAYSPNESDRFAFGPPLWARIPGYIFLAFAATVGLLVLYAHFAPSNSRLYIWIVEGDHHRAFGSAPLAFVIAFTAIGNVIKTGLRGVIVTAEGIEARILLAGGFPKVRRWTWAQVDRLVIDGEDVMVELWNGEYERLPKVKDGEKLANLLASIATARGRAVTRLSKSV